MYLEKLGITAEFYKTIRLLGRLSAPFNVRTSSVVRSLRFSAEKQAALTRVDIGMSRASWTVGDYMVRAQLFR